MFDNLRVHHGKLVKAWLAEKRERIEVFYLPSYSPQVNPDKRLNADLKYDVGVIHKNKLNRILAPRNSEQNPQQQSQRSGYTFF